MDVLELPPARRLNDEQLSRLERQLLAQLGASAERPASALKRPDRRRSPRRRIVLIAAVVCAAAGSAVALAVAFRGQPGTDIACLSDPSLAARVYDMVPNQQDAIAACTREWQNGALSANGQPSTVVPNLVACLTSRAGHDQIVVLPARHGETCQRLNLEPYNDARDTGNP